MPALLEEPKKVTVKPETVPESPPETATLSIFEEGIKAYQNNPRVDFNKNPYPLGEKPDSPERRKYTEWSNGWNQACHQESMKSIRPTHEILK